MQIPLTTLAVHWGPLSSPDPRVLCDFILGLMEKCGLPPTHGSGNEDRKITTFSSFKRRWAASRQPLDFSVFNVCAQDVRGGYITDYEFVGALNRRRILVISAVAGRYDEILDWPKVCAEVYRLAPFAYGYAHVSLRSTGPYLDACGLSFQSEIRAPTKEDFYRSRLNHWADIAMRGGRWNRPEIVYALRSVYPLQFITKRHFELRVGRQGLRRWIESDPRRGTLEPIADGCWAWRVEGDENLESVRLALYRAGLLWAWWPFGEEEPDSDRPLGR
jgi:hypothetical protein